MGSGSTRLHFSQLPPNTQSVGAAFLFQLLNPLGSEVGPPSEKGNDRTKLTGMLCKRLSDPGARCAVPSSTHRDTVPLTSAPGGQKTQNTKPSGSPGPSCGRTPIIVTNPATSRGTVGSRMFLLPRDGPGVTQHRRLLNTRPERKHSCSAVSFPLPPPLRHPSCKKRQCNSGRVI